MFTEPAAPLQTRRGADLRPANLARGIRRFALSARTLNVAGYVAVREPFRRTAGGICLSIERVVAVKPLWIITRPAADRQLPISEIRNSREVEAVVVWGSSKAALPFICTNGSMPKHEASVLYRLCVPSQGSSSVCLAQDRATGDSNKLTREEWQSRVNASRERLEQRREELRLEREKQLGPKQEELQRDRENRFGAKQQELRLDREKRIESKRDELRREREKQKDLRGLN